jgi:hypothetical protein
MKKILMIFYSLQIIWLVQGAAAAEFRGGMNIGYNGGLGFDVNGTTYQFAQDLPLAIRLNLGYAVFDPGNATAARKIFINNDEGGTIEEKGWIYRFGLDLLYPVRLFKLPESYIILGPRYSRFTGNFKYIGDNEDFDVTSTHWGIGLGLETAFPINQKFDFILNTGADYFFASTLYGHDTSYSPDGQSNNPQEDYEYTDADDAINQPKLEFRLMVGFSYTFGKQK